MQIKTRLAVALLSVSIAGASSTAVYEGWSAKPYFDSVGVATIGYGSTVHPDGRKVKITDAPIDKRTGLEYLRKHMSKDEERVKASLKGAKMTQEEFDIAMDFAYNFGVGSWKKSSMRKSYLTGNYRQACLDYLKWFRAGGRDCRVRGNNCHGVWKRAQDRSNKCLAQLDTKSAEAGSNGLRPWLGHQLARQAYTSMD